jgi:PAS domain S-box-containing protein
VKEINDALLDMLGLTRTEFESKGLAWRALLAPELDHDMATLRSEGRIGPRELILEAKSGVRVSVMATATRLEGGEDEQAIFLTDLTPLKSAEAALRQTRQRFEHAVRGVSAIIYEIDTRTGIVERTESVRRVIGVGVKAIEPTVEGWLARLHPDDRPAFEAAITEIKSGLREEFELEYRVRHENGRWLTIWDRAFVEHGDAGAMKVVGVCVDITERKKNEERLNTRARSQGQEHSGHRCRDHSAKQGSGDAEGVR